MSSAQPHIVLVDHDLDTLKALVFPLRGRYQFHLTISGSDALDLLTRETVSVLISGQTLFSGTGVEVLREAQRRSPQTKRVLLVDAAERKAFYETEADSRLCELLNRACSSEQLREFLKSAAGSMGLQAGTESSDSVEHVVMETVSRQPVATMNSAVPVTVLTTDADLFQSILGAVQGRHEAYLATSLEDALALAADGRCPVLVTDFALQQSALQRIAARLQTHEPSLVTIVVGTREQGNALMDLLSSGAIHRFLLKPVTSGLARLAIDSAARQHQALKSQPHAEPAFEFRPLADDIPAQMRIEARPDKIIQPPRVRYGRKLSAVIIILLVMAGAAVAWWQLTHRAPPVDTRRAAIESNLAAAAQAVQEQRLIAPPATSALHYYSRALELDPRNSTATSGIDGIADHFVEQAEAQLVQGRAAAAAQSLATVRQLRPEHRRLRFLEAQLQKEQQEQLLLQARQSATAGDLRQAQDLVEQAAKANPAQSIGVASTQQAIDAQERDQAVARWIDLARQRVAQGRLANPASDSAKFYLRSAQQADPDNVVVQQGLRDLAQRVVLAADQAIASLDLPAAAAWLGEAEDLAVEPGEIARLRQALSAATDQKSKTDLLQLALRRTQENRLLDPVEDSAVHHLNRLAVIDAAFPGLDQATQALGLKLVASARQATTQRQLDAATRFLTAARQIGFAGPELAAADAALRAARAPVSAAPRIPQEVPPKRVKYVAPKYPENAIADNREGWVDLSFMVTVTGEVTDVKVEAANPRNIFERAAITAVRQWKFEPRSGLDPSFTQQVKTRVEFKLTK